MNIESLPNELFVEVFTYLSTTDLFDAFDGLNERFHHLISEHFRKCGLDFQGISQSNFNKICQKYLPRLIDQVPSIGFNNDERTPGQVDRFYSHGLKLDQFTHLQSLSVLHLRSEVLAHRLISELQDMPYLIDLTYKSFCYPSNRLSACHFISGIWRLKKLQRCHIGFELNPFEVIPIPLIQSMSLQCLTIEGTDLVEGELARLINQTPNLTNISFRFTFQLPSQFWLRTPPQITKLNVFSSFHSGVLIGLLEKIPSICELKVHMSNSCINGHKWEEVIRQYLPNLKILQFLMVHRLSEDQNHEQEIDRILETFRSHFWLCEYRHFVRCDWYMSLKIAHIYTLPYSFHGFAYSSTALSKTTCLGESKRYSYHSVRELAYSYELSESVTLSQIQFDNIHKLSIKLPFDDLFWSTISNFDRVTYLVVSLNNNIETCQTQLTILLNQLPYLSTLFIREQPSSVLELLTFENMFRLRYDLDLYFPNLCYDNDQCKTLACLSVVKQCRTLTVAVQNRFCINDLVQTMKNLQSLSVFCRDDQWQPGTDPEEDEVVKWLERELPSSCQIRRYSPYQMIGIWIS